VSNGKKFTDLSGLFIGPLVFVSEEQLVRLVWVNVQVRVWGGNLVSQGCRRTIRLLEWGGKTHTLYFYLIL